MKKLLVLAFALAASFALPACTTVEEEHPVTHTTTTTESTTLHTAPSATSTTVHTY